MSGQPNLFDETTPVPGAARFPVEVEPPPGFNPLDVATWPRVEGRLEYLRGRLLYMPPCGDVQQDVAARIVGLLDRWLDEHEHFKLGGNEAGMLLGGEVRAAEAAIWRQGDLRGYTGGYRRVPPLLAVEVAGRDEDEAVLRHKVAWYFEHGVRFVWLLLPAPREVVVLRAAGGERRLAGAERIAEEPELPGLAFSPDEIFRRLD
jgi:Uma2 family endonuclease